MRPLRSAARLGLILLWVARAGAEVSESAPREWEPGAAVEGKGYAYQIFSRHTEGEAFAHYQIRGTIDAEPEALLRAFRLVVTDPSRAPDRQTRRVIANDAEAFVVHTVMDLPALFSDRDIVTRGEVSTDPATGARLVHWKAIEHAAAPRADGRIRIERAAGSWIFAPADGGRSHVTYENYIDLGGSLPQWILDRVMASTVGKAYEDVAAEAIGRD